MGEKKSSHYQMSRKERKAKKRAAEDLIPDIPAPEPALSSSVNEERVLDKKANISELKGKNKRKRSRAEDDGADEKDNDEGKKNNIDEEKLDEKKKRKQSKKSSNKELKICGEVDNSCESVKKDVNQRDEEEKIELSVKDRERKKEKGKEHKKKKISNLRIEGEERSPVADQEPISKKSKKDRKAELKAAAPKPSNDGHDKESETTVDDKKFIKVGSNTAGKEISNEDDSISTTTNIEEKKTSKTKKDKKKKKKSQEQAGEATSTSTSDTTTANTSPSKTVSLVGGKTSETRSVEKSSTSAGSKSTAAAATAARFIVFVGNLPYTATTASIMSHFRKLKPLSVRHLTKKDDPSKSRGIAFVEFENYDTHKTALKIMHHSIFDDGQSEPRMINVELTAGGGGNTEDRKAKIKSKNERLNEQRIRRIEEEDKAKLKKEEEKAKLSKGPLSEPAQSSSESNIHPSRRRMITV